jgi:DnaJ-class molecular chaperone
MSSNIVEDYESMCHECGGTGKVRSNNKSYWYGGAWKPKRNTCPRCKGTGKLDWIARCTKKE